MSAITAVMKKEVLPVRVRRRHSLRADAYRPQRLAEHDRGGAVQVHDEPVRRRSRGQFPHRPIASPSLHCPAGLKVRLQ